MAELNEHELKVQAWLDTPVDERSLEVGATLMLQVNRNRILHQNVIQKKNFAKIVYELKKYMGVKLVIAPVETTPVESPEVIESKLIPVIAITTEKLKFEGIGKRSDHDQLPAGIKLMFDMNQEIYPEMRALHEKLKVLSEDGHTAAERLPFLQDLLHLDNTLRGNWELYDNFKMGDVIPGEKKVIVPGVALDFKRIQANRTYLNRAGKEILEKITAGKQEAADKQLAEAQIRYNELILDGQTIDEATSEKLKAAGVIIQVVESKVESTVPGEQIVDPANPEILPAAAVEKIVDPVDQMNLVQDEATENTISQIRTLLKNNITVEGVKGAFSKTEKVGLKELTPEFLDQMILMAIESLEKQVDQPTVNAAEGIGAGSGE